MIIAQASIGPQGINPIIENRRAQICESETMLNIATTKSSILLENTPQTSIRA